MHIDEFIKKRMSNNDASIVLQMNGEDVKNFTEKWICTEAKGTDFMKSIFSAKYSLGE